MPRKKKSNLLTKVPATALTGVALDHYNSIMPVLVADELANKLDVAIIESACEIYAQYKAALLNAEDGDSPLGYIKAYVAIMEKYGATPKARQAMKIAEAPPAKDKEAQELLADFKNRK